jgi:hypothetical protein
MFYIPILFNGQNIKITDSESFNNPWTEKSMCLAAAWAVAVASCQTVACAVDIMVLRRNS